MRIAWVLWRGALGGAETLAADLVDLARREGDQASLVFVTNAGDLTPRVAQRSIPSVTLGATTERSALLRARALGRLLEEVAPDGVVLPTTGLLPLALRAGGYRRPIIAVEHGDLLQVPSLPTAVRWRRTAMRRAGRRAVSVEIGVSEYMFSALQDGSHAARTACIPNGVDLARFRPAGRDVAEHHGAGMVLGWAGRMIPGKGLDVLLRALASVDAPVALRLAGDGPERYALQRLAGRLGLTRITFEGRVTSTEHFWAGCDVGAATSDAFIESFGIAPIEAAACGLPVIATANGALTEVIADGVSGLVVPPGDAAALAAAITTYAGSAALRAEHGAEGRRRVQDRYSLEQCLNGYRVVIAKEAARPSLAA